MHYLLFGITLLVSSSHFVNGDCVLNLTSSSPTYPPLFISGSGTIIQPTYKSSSRIITLTANQQITVACPGTTLIATGQELNAASCSVAGSTLQVGTQSLSYGSLGCSAALKESVVESGSCEQNGTRIQIGWQIGASTFINQITSCHVQSTANTLYSASSIYGANMDANDKANPRPLFQKGNYYVGLNPDSSYSQYIQNITVQNLVGSAALTVKYVNISKNFYMARGHLSPDGDFIDGASQNATYYYFNAAPQWQSFNAGNWETLESKTRYMAINRRVTLKVYTGTFGKMTLADVNGVQQGVDLAKDANNNAVLPVPKYYWKVVHDPASNNATAFVGINNPHMASVQSGDVFCTDVCGQVPWVQWTNRTDITKGYMFCCSVQSLYNAIPYAPNLGNLNLLV